MAGITGLRYNFSRTDVDETTTHHQQQQQSPLFERQMSNDEYTEYQQLRNIIDSLHLRINKLEKINIDLETRLEEQAKQSLAVETELINVERKWKLKCEQLSQEILKWKTDADAEKIKNNRLRDHLSNTERELYIILQRKHELMRGGPGISSTKGVLPNGKLAPSDSGILRKSDFNESSDAEMYQMQSSKMREQPPPPKQKEPKIIREKKAIANLSDFLGF